MTRRGFSSLLKSSALAATDTAAASADTGKSACAPLDAGAGAHRGQEEEASWETHWRRGCGHHQQQQHRQHIKTRCQQRWGLGHLDSAQEELTERLKPERERCVASIKEELSAYEELDDYRSEVDQQFDSRDSYEMHLRGEASRELRRSLDEVLLELHHEKLRRLRSSRHLEGFETKSEEEQVVMIGLMAVHVTTEKRLQQLKHTLQSIEAQDLSNCRAELHMAISWYTSDTTLAMKVQELFHHFVASRKKRHWSGESDEEAPRGARADGRHSFARFAAARQTEPDVASTPSTAVGSSSPATVVIRQTKRHTQFQHYRAALEAVESELCWRWGVRPGTTNRRSIWVVFGDDDDLWHSRRTAEYARAISNHPDIDSVASLATLTRVGIGLCEGQKSVPESALPDSASQVDEYLNLKTSKPYKGANHADDEACQKFQKQLSRDGGTDEPPPEDIMMEHFDYSPRLRILHEFFETTSEEILAHRYCDLRLCEFLETYPRFGQELGLELSFFKPKCWMYFYRNQGIDPDSFSQSIEESEEVDPDAPLPAVLFAGVEHVSAEVPISSDVVEMAQRESSKFKEHDAQMTQAKLTKHLAVFRGMMEHYLVRLHTRKIDQRRLDGLVVANAMQSFGRFALSISDSGLELTSTTAQHLLEVCQTIAAKLASDLGVDVFWYTADAVIVPGKIFLGHPTPNTGKGKGKGKGYLHSHGVGGAYPQCYQYEVLPPASQRPEEQDVVHFKWKIPGCV